MVKLGFRSFIFLYILFLHGCQSAPMTPQHALTDQIISPRPDHSPNLTNSHCIEQLKGECNKLEITDYNLNDEKFRHDANDLDFICNVGNRRFKICMDKPGLCRRECHKKCFLFICGKEDCNEEYIPVDRYQFLIDSKSRCFNKGTYPFDLFGN